MATIQTAQSWLASSPSTWAWWVIPVEWDKVIINANHIVTIDWTYTWGDDNNTATLNTAAVTVSGTIKASRTVSSSLTIKGLLLCNVRTQAIDYWTDADPIPLWVTAELVLNKATTPSNRDGIRQFLPASFTALDWSLQTFVWYNGRERGMPLQNTITAWGSTFTLMSASHGWGVGDEVLFFNTTNNSTVDECETRIIQSISGATITLTAPVTYTHLANSPVANKTSNVIIRSYNEVSNQMANPSLNFPNTLTPATLGTRYIFKNVKFQNLWGTWANSWCINSFASATSTSIHTIECEKNVIINNKTSASFVNVWPAQRMNINKCVFDINWWIVYGIWYVEINNSYIWLCTASGGWPLTQANTWWLTHTNNWITARRWNITLFINSNTIYNNCIISWCTTNITSAWVVWAVFNDCDLGYTYGWKALFWDNLQRLTMTAEGTGNTILNRCLVNPVLSTPSPEASMALQWTPYFVSYFDRDNNLNNQEIYKASGILLRENSLYNRSTSSHKMKMLKVNSDSFRDILIYATPWETITVVWYIRIDSTFYNAWDCFYPTATISGNSITPVVHTATSASNGAWEKFTLTATNGTTNGGYFTLRLNARAKTTLWNVYFDWLPDYPFVTNCRHYGYTFDETNIKRTVDIYSVATEPTASGYTGVSINGATKRISFTSWNIDNSQKFYDYSRYWAVNNLDKEVPFFRNWNTFSMVSNWIFETMPYSDITIQWWTIELTTAWTYDFKLNTSTLDLKTAWIYNLKNATLDNITFINSSGWNITIKLNPWVTYTNTWPNITVDNSVNITISAPNIIDWSRYQIYNKTQLVELENMVVSGWLGIEYTTTFWVWQPIEENDEILFTICWQNWTNAKIPIIETFIATWNYLLNKTQEDDEKHNQLWYDWSLIDKTNNPTTWEIIADFANIQIDVNDPDNVFDSRKWIAWWRYICTTEQGIRLYNPNAINYNPDTRNIIVYWPLQLENTKVWTNLKITEWIWIRADWWDICVARNDSWINWVPNDRIYQWPIITTSSWVVTWDIVDIETIINNAKNDIKGVDNKDLSEINDNITILL